ncbi:hypothetical protein OG741_30795 [Streptomyces sp. NBC_01410]|uniref:CU044_2847 family protein n=1 Tax=Streptomyces sp. NBC_01410 TaxID=2903856 RepID=UPI003245325D
MAGEEVLTAVELPDGTRLMLQAVNVAPERAGAGPEDGEGEPLEEEIGLLSFNLDEVTEALGTFAQGVTGALRRAKPHRLTVEFGCQVGVETSGLVALITKGSVDANLTVTMEWDWTAQQPEGSAGSGGSSASGGTGGGN